MHVDSRVRKCIVVLLTSVFIVMIVGCSVINPEPPPIVWNEGKEKKDELLHEAAAAAEQDVNINTAGWVLGGTLSSALGTGLGTIIAAATLEGDEWGWDRSESVMILTGFIGPPIVMLMYADRPVPVVKIPPERLIGKSPEYIEAYTHFYREKTRVARTQAGLFGCVATPILLGLSGLLNVLD